MLNYPSQVHTYVLSTTWSSNRVFAKDIILLWHTFAFRTDAPVWRT